MAVLQTLKFLHGNELHFKNCIVNEVQCNGNHTVCGMNIVDSYIEEQGFEAVGEEFDAPLTECTCPQCLNIIRYFKKLR